MLNNILNGCIPLYGYEQRLNDNEKGFKHNLQSVRVVSQLEFHNEKEPGLNLTKFTMWGLAHHTSTEPKECEYWNATNEQCSVYSSHSSCQRSNLSLGFYNSTLRYNDKQILNDCEDWNFESFVVAISDEIAQRHHDIEDSLCAGIVESNEVVNCVLNMSVWSIEEQSILNELNSCNSIEKIIPQISKVIVNKYVNETINMFRKSFEEIKKEYSIISSTDFSKKRREIWSGFLHNGDNISKYFGLSESIKEGDQKIRELLNSRVLLSELAQSMDGKAQYLIMKILKAYLNNPQQLPDATIVKAISEISHNSSVVTPGEARKQLKEKLREGKLSTKHILLRTICDYIAGMTEQFAYRQAKKLYSTEMVEKWL